MRRTTLLIILVLVAGIVIGYFARSVVGTVQQKHAHKADLASIEKAHQEDIEATLTQDPKRLIDLWAEDAVAFSTAGPGGWPSRPSGLRMRNSTPRTRASRC